MLIRASYSSVYVAVGLQSTDIFLNHFKKKTSGKKFTGIQIICRALEF
jgi:hypothetical protein